MSTAPPVEDTAPARDDEASHSGRLLLRMPQSLHAELAREAEREGVSLNGFITGALASAVSWRAERQERATPAQRSTLFRIAIAIDLVLVAIAAAISIALLIAAWP
jgi:RNA polymerase sigma-B factor